MQEVRKVAGDPNVDKTKKVVFLATHSPFILDFRSVEDVKSVISFSLDHSEPRHILDLDASASARLSSLVPRLNVHHKQLFFSDNPIFVEGILDAQLIGAIQESRGVSVAGAGSCIIDAGGCEEVNHYLELCTAFGKRAHFLYDLDSLFGDSLKACVRDDCTVRSFLMTAGVGNDFGKYCGELESKLTSIVDQLLGVATVPPGAVRLVEYLRALGPRKDWKGKVWAKARVAVITAISRFRADVVAATSQADVEEIEGRIKQIVASLRQRNIALLPGGTLERYLPSYTGDTYELSDDAKRQAMYPTRWTQMASGMSVERRLAWAGYGALYESVSAMPGKIIVDVDPVLRRYLSQYIHDLQRTVVGNPEWTLAEVQAHIKTIQRSTDTVFVLQKLDRGRHKEFSAVIGINVAPSLGSEGSFA